MTHDAIIQDVENFLSHHGIQGQKWGVRHGPPYPLGSGVSTGKSLKKGAKPKNIKKSELIKKNSIEYGINPFLVAYGIYATAILSTIVGTYGYVGARFVSNKLAGKSAKNKIKKSEKDEKTDLPLKKEERTKEQDVKDVNKYARGEGERKYATKNCMSCTTAYELRRRGYEVYAEALNNGFTDDACKDWWKNAKIVQAKSNPKTETEKSLSNSRALDGKNTEFAKDLMSELSKQPEGSRGNLMISWAGFGGGHSLIYEVDNGKVVIRDAQSNKNFIKEKDVEKLLSRTVDATYLRTDNLDMNIENIKKVVKWRT